MEITAMLCATWLITLALVLLVGLLRGTRPVDSRASSLIATLPRDCNVLLLACVVEREGQLGCYVNGPNGGYQTSHELYAAAVLSAGAIRHGGQGIEAGLELVQRATMKVLSDGGSREMES